MLSFESELRRRNIRCVAAFDADLRLARFGGFAPQGLHPGPLRAPSGGNPSAQKMIADGEAAQP